MKSLNTKYHLSMLPFLFILLLSFTYADNNTINGICPGEIIEEINGATVTTTHTENGAIGNNGNDRYRMTFPSAGTLSISAANRDSSKNARYDFYVSRNNCGNNDSDWNIQGPKVPRATQYAENVAVNAGDTIWVRLQSRKSEPTSGRHSYALTLSFTPTPIQNIGAFAQKYTIYLKGNLKVIGNTVLQSPNPGSTLSNAQLNLSYVNINGGSGRFNSSSATIDNTEAGVDVTGARIKWAGLYWQGYLHNDTGDTGIDAVYNFSTSQSTANTQIPNAINNQSVLLKVGSNPYISIPADEIGMDRQYNQNNYVSYKYAAFANVTSLLKDLAPSTTYTVANIPTRSGQTSSGNVYDGLGNYGAWALVVVYDNNTSLSEKTRNITVFDGYTVLSAANNPSQTINLSGFKTPSIAPNGVDSTLSVFAGEGDRNILGDFATLTNQDGYTYNLPDTSGAGSYFASVIEGVPTRNPIIINNNGIDIHTAQVGTSGGNNRPIKENQTTASVTLGTTQDTFMPSMIAFATELFTPDLCYDYDVRIGDHIKFLLITERSILTNLMITLS